ncbi:helix-turn-helix domain-containing protein [Haloechinothrix halophila]|uniref:helix-turn-helix domain-containing protein n=1 Tax=Haloechinothrix halophila TaxID=1069073 RepID=UPI000A015252|nr:helix-turn-helix transcriptional regulator [Haloechinothrix halophila]
MLQEPNGHRRRNLAVALRDLRNASGLSRERLAAKAQLSQSKISRVETGRTIPTVADTERILRALEVPKSVATELLSLARAANVDYASWRSVARLGIWHKQNELKSLANDSAYVRQFLPAIPSGLLQTPEYARETFTPAVDGRPARDVDRAVQARMDSQECLDDESRRFSFILTEQALDWRQAPQEVMASQRERLVEVSSRSNVDLAVLPIDAVVKVPALNVFVVYDDRLVIVETFSGEMALRDPRDVSYHLNLFDYFYDLSLHGDDARTRIMQVRD